MAWHRKGDKPLTEAMMTQFTDALMQHQRSLDKMDINKQNCI